MQGPGQQAMLQVHPVSNYTFGTKAFKQEKDTSVQQRMERIKDKQVRFVVCERMRFVLLPPTG
jgi:hypothetical protein